MIYHVTLLQKTPIAQLGGEERLDQSKQVLSYRIKQAESLAEISH